MNYRELRKKHPRLIYKSYAFEQTQTELNIQFEYFLEPDITFKPTIKVPIPHKIDSKQIENFIFSLGIIEGLNYWKAAVPQIFHIESGNIDSYQTSWWHQLFIQGLGEFYFVNQIDFTEKDFLEITSNNSLKQLQIFEDQNQSGELILSSGGKDSAVTLELIKGLSNKQSTFTQIINNPKRAPQEAAEAAGYNNQIYAYKQIDPKLIQFGKEGYLTGHVPFSSMLAFLSLLIAKLYNYKSVIASNESSANEPNLNYLDTEINHQYAKSFTFEKALREYSNKYLSKGINYFSFLRPLSELQVAMIFSNYTKHFNIFRSCNNNIKQDTWCGKCAKCAFVFLLLHPFISKEQRLSIFGDDYFKSPEIINHIKDIVGLGEHKPLECVGTKEEAIFALQLTKSNLSATNQSPSPLLQKIYDDLKLQSVSNDQINQEIKKWNSQNFLPVSYQELLKNKLETILI